MAPLSLRRALALTFALTCVSAPPLLAQPDDVGACEGTLATAADRYANQAYDKVEPLVLDCVYRPDATTSDVQQAYRLLALTFIKQDLLTDAQLTIVKLLGADYSYEADPVADPPFYVALVDAVKNQLRIDAQAAPEVGAAEVSKAEDASQETILVNLNTATAEELDAVPGIGPARAESIVAYRTQNGPFRTVRDLESVSGIGPRNIEPMLPYLTVDGTTMVTLSGGGVTDPAREASVERSPPAIEAATVAALINLNTATAEELESLKGIGPTLAARIVTYREEYGPFQTVEDVMRVSGIGPGKLAGFADRVTVE